MVSVTAHRQLSGKSPADLRVGGVGRQPAAEERVERLERSARCCAGSWSAAARGTRCCIFIAQPIVCAWRSVITSVAGISSSVRRPFALPASGASSTSRFCRTTRDVARARPLRGT